MFAEIRNQLRDAADKEAMKLFRMARKAQQHGVNQSTVDAIREEGFKLHTLSSVEVLLNPFVIWTYAFK